MCACRKWWHLSAEDGRLTVSKLDFVFRLFYIQVEFFQLRHFTVERNLARPTIEAVGWSWMKMHNHAWGMFSERALDSVVNSLKKKGGDGGGSRSALKEETQQFIVTAIWIGERIAVVLRYCALWQNVLFRADILTEITTQLTRTNKKCVKSRL